MHTNLPDLGIKKVLDTLPNKITPRLQNVAATDIVVVQHITLAEHLLVPLWEVEFLAHGNANELGILDLGILLRLGHGLLDFRLLRLGRCSKRAECDRVHRGLHIRQVGHQRRTRHKHSLGRRASMHSIYGTRINHILVH